MKTLIEIKVPESKLETIASFLISQNIKYKRVGLSFFIPERHFRRQDVRNVLDNQGVLYPV